MPLWVALHSRHKESPRRRPAGAFRFVEPAACALPGRGRSAAHQVLVDRMGRLAAFADRPDDQRLATAHVAGGVDLVDRGCVALRCRPARLPRWSSSAPSSVSMPSCSGPAKPMAMKTRSARMMNSVPSIGRRFSSTRAHSTPVTLPFLPTTPKRRAGELALGALGLRGRGAELGRPVGPDRQLVLAHAAASGGCRAG